MAATVSPESDDGPIEPDPTPSPTPARSGALRALAELVRGVPGVATVVCDDGQAASGAERGALAGLEQESLILGRLARRVGDAFQSGRPLVAVIQGTQRSLLLLQAKGGSLSILTKPEARADAVHAEIRRMIAARRP